MIWLKTDADRCGAPSFFVDGSFSFERYRDYALDTPMYFIFREGEYLDFTHMTFRHYLNNPGKFVPTETDWVNHLTTLFPDVRLKDHLEYRTADATPKALSIGHAAFWTGLVYNQGVLDEVVDRFKHITPEQQAHAIRDAALKGMAGEAYGRKIADWASELVPLVNKGLKADDQELFQPLAELIHGGKSLAEKVRESNQHLSWATFQNDTWSDV